MNTSIFLIRHGITEGNERKWYYGSSDLPLSAEGMEEIKRLSGEGIYPLPDGAAFFVTELMRTRQTLFLIYGNVPYRVIPELNEMSFGRYEKKSHQELMESERYRKWLKTGDRDLAFPAGESINGFNERIMRGFSGLLSFHERKSIVICHGGAISHIMAECFPEEKEHFIQWIPLPGRGFCLHLNDGKVCGHEAL